MEKKKQSEDFAISVKKTLKGAVDLRDDGKKRLIIKKKKVIHKPVTHFVGVNEVVSEITSR